MGRRARRSAGPLGIAIVGDIPIFVAHDSADVWANQHLFKLDERGQPRVVAGVPPDYFSATGQLWGNPLYDWDAMAAERVRVVDRALPAPARAGRPGAHRSLPRLRGGLGGARRRRRRRSTARGSKGPGNAVFEAIAEALGGGQPPVIAEDLGLITDEVRALLQATGFPGMKVLQFAFGGGADNPVPAAQLSSIRTASSTPARTTTTPRAAGSPAPRTTNAPRCSAISAATARTSPEDLIRLALSSTANTAIVPLQDVLDLGSEARMNTPGRQTSNWTWRVAGRPARRRAAPSCLAELTDTYGRSQTDQ